MELADAIGLVARLLQRLHKGGDLGEEIPGHGQGADLTAVAAGDEGGAGRGADGVGGIAVGKPRPLGKIVDIGGPDDAVRRVARVFRALLVSHEQQDISGHSSLPYENAAPRQPVHRQGCRRAVTFLPVFQRDHHHLMSSVTLFRNSTNSGAVTSRGRGRGLSSTVFTEVGLLVSTMIFWLR